MKYDMNEDRRTAICSNTIPLHKAVKWPEEVYPVCAHCGAYCNEDGHDVGGRLNAEEFARFLDWYTKPQYILSTEPPCVWYIARALVATWLRALADWIEP